MNGPRVLHVIQGTFEASDSPDVVIQTLLGSCVATCLHDPLAKVGGMNHFLLPGTEDSSQHSLSYGTHAMELLINRLLRMGARRERLEAKLFGGARVIEGMRAIGESNGRFAMKFLRDEGIKCVSSSLGGLLARKVRFFPTTGQAQQMFVERLDEPIEQPIQRPYHAASSGEVELF